MDHHNSLSPFSSGTFGGLAGFSYQSDATGPQLHFKGMSVQTRTSPRSLCFNQFNAGQNDAHFIHSLREFSIESLTQTFHGSFEGSDFPVLDSFFSEYPPQNFGNETFDDALSAQPISYLSNPPFPLGSNPDFRGRTPANGLTPDLTDSPAELPDSQGSGPVAVVNPLNLQRTASDRPANPARIEQKKRHQRERYRTDPDFAERLRKYNRNRKKERYRSDPVYAESKRIYSKIYTRMIKTHSKQEAAKHALAAKRRYLQSAQTKQKLNKNFDASSFSSRTS